MDLFTTIWGNFSMYIPYKRDLAMPPALKQRLSDDWPKISLDAAGLVALADLTTVARRTALTGTSCLLDALVVCPGLHKQQDAPTLHAGEYPACAALTSGYVFRVENPATVFSLQKVGRTGHLTTVTVTGRESGSSVSRRAFQTLFDSDAADGFASLAYGSAVCSTIVFVLVVIWLEDWVALAVVSTLGPARLINVVIIRRRATMGWRGAREPGVQGDLLILLSADRWIRMRGAVDDLKATTSGRWLREPTFVESSLTAFSTLLVYLDAALAGNAKQEGKLLLLVLLFCSGGLLGLVNEFTDKFKLYDRLVQVKGEPEKFARRLDLAKKLIEETGREDWAIRLGMIAPSKTSETVDDDVGPKTMEGRGIKSTVL